MSLRALGPIVLVAVLLASGCLQSSGLSYARQDQVPPGELKLFVAQRPVAAESLWHEERHETAALPVQDTFIIENSWEPRDVALTYHGIHPVYDEWAHEVPAHIFRYARMGLVVTNVEFLGGFAGVRVTARYEPELVEHAFEASTARYLGTVLVDHQVRVFDDARWPTPLNGGYDELLFMTLAVAFLQNDLTRPLEVPFGNVTFEPTEFRPLAGECQPLEATFRPAPWYQRWQDEQNAGPIEAPQDHHKVVCVQGPGVPLWVYQGNTTDHLRLERKGAALAPLQRTGTALPPTVFQARDFEPVNILLGVAKPIAAPPSAYPGDWADLGRPVIQAAGTGLDYIQWQLDRDNLHLAGLSKAFPATPAGLPLLGLDPVGFEKESWVMVGDGQDLFWAFVESRYGGPEDPDLHLSQRGVALDDYPTHAPRLVPAGEVQALWETLLPVDPAFLTYSSFPDVLDVPPEYAAYLEPFLRTWSGFEFCFEERTGGRYGMFSATEGQMLVLAGQTSTANGCSAGVQDSTFAASDGFLRLGTSQHPILLRPASGDAPGVLVLPALGQAYRLDPA